MSGPYLFAFFVLWFYALALGVLVIILIRQVGVLNLRLGPSGAFATNDGPVVGERLAGIGLETPEGRFVDLGKRNGQPTVLTFVSGTCHLCRELLPAARSIADSYPEVQLFLVGLGERRAFDDLTRKLRRTSMYHVFAPLVADALRVHSTPYGVAVDPRGVVVAKGIVNQIEHLEHLVHVAVHGPGPEPTDAQETVAVQSASLP